MRSQNTPNSTSPKSNIQRSLAQEKELLAALAVIEQYSPGITARMIPDLQKIANAAAGDSSVLIDEFEIKYMGEVQ